MCVCVCTDICMHHDDIPYRERERGREREREGEGEQGAMVKAMANKTIGLSLIFSKFNLIVCVKKCRDVMCLCYKCI